MAGFRLPGPTHRTAVTGSTGSGKSQFACWLLSTRNILDRPWTIIDHKKDELIGELGARELPLGSAPPKAPGLYVIRPLPNLHDAWIEKYMWQVLSQEDHGIYIDEGYMIPRTSKALLALLTQGRSKHIEMIMLTQRPRFCHPMMFSEADFLSVFRLNKPADRDVLQDAISASIKNRLPEYNSYWYDVGRDRAFVMKPAPDRDTIIESFERFNKRPVRVI